MATRSHKLTGSAAGVLAYLQDESAVLDYYGTDKDGFDQVWGKLGEEFGLERGLTREQFTRAFNGQHPITGEQLAKVGYKQVIHEDGTVETVATRTGAIDVVYGCPKSIAILYVEASPDMRKKLDDLVLNAAHAAHDAMEATAKLARVSVKTPTEVGARSTKQQGSQTERVTADLLTVPTIQFVARPTETSEKRGAPGVDPSVHVHATTLTLCKAGDRYLTADEFGLKNRANAKYRDAVFMGELARGLEGIGVQLEYTDFERAKGGEIRWEVKGSDEELRRYWSTNNERAWAIRRQYEEEHGKPIDEVKLGEILYATRRRKSKEAKEQDSHPNWELWRADAEQAGFKLRALHGERRAINRDPRQSAEVLEERLMSSNGLCVSDAVFDAESIRPAVARCAVGLGLSPDQLDGFTRALTRDLVVVRDAVEPEHRLFTTQPLVDAEDNIATQHERRMDQWVSVTGAAGTGKSTAVGVAVETIRSLAAVEAGESAHVREALKAAMGDRVLNDGQLDAVKAIVRAGAGADQVVVASTAAATAERTGIKVKADKWGSVESIVARIEKGSLRMGKDTLLVVEEAGQLDTLRMDKLLRAVGDARVVSLGDSGQLSAISAAGWYTDGIEKHGSVELTEVKRQKDQRDVEDYALVRDGRSAEALENLASRGRTHTADTDAERLALALGDYRGHRDAGRQARDVRVVLDSSNVEVDTANRFIQRDRIERAEITPTGIEVEQADTGRRWELHENDQVIMLETCQIRGSSPIKNGMSGTIRKINGDGTARIHFQGGGEERVPISAAIGLDYAKHVAKFQGGEVPIALIVPGRGQSNRNSGYTMLTRAIEEAHVYVSDEAGGVEALAERWATPAVKDSARAAFEKIRGDATVSELPPVHADEIEIDDIKLEPVELAPLSIGEGEKVSLIKREKVSLLKKTIEPESSDGTEEQVEQSEDHKIGKKRSKKQKAEQEHSDPFDRTSKDPFDRPRVDPFDKPDPFELTRSVDGMER